MKNIEEQQYLSLLTTLLEGGNVKDDRTGTGVSSIFGGQMRFTVSDHFPLLTTKKLYLRAIIHELLWFISGDTNIAYLKENNVNIWNEWATETGELGPVYGHQWRHWDIPGGGYVDQLKELVHEIKTNPTSRRLVLSAWNPAVLPDPKISPKQNAALGKQALPPCHCLFQFYVFEDKLSLQLYQRSADIFLGVPFNIASYALLLQMVAQVCNLRPHEFVHTFGDVHLYKNHFEQARLQLSREPLPFPTMKINPDVTDLFKFTFDDFELQDYTSHPAIKAEISV